MSEEKKLVVNCDICDARKVKEEELSKFSQIVINTNYLFVDERSKAVLKQFPIEWDMTEMIQLEEGEEVGIINYNGSCEITSDMPFSGKKLLCVNGKLMIHPGTEEIIKSFIRILVNGQVCYPDSMSAVISQISVNGGMESYPGDYKMMGKEFVIDRYFPIRAKEGGKYYATKQMEITDTEADIAALVRKGVHFKTKELYVLEEKLEDCVELFDEEVHFQVIPTGFRFVRDTVVLDKNLLGKYGTRLYIGGNLILEEDSKEVLQQIEGLHIVGTLYLREGQIEELKQKDIWYEKMEIVKGDIIWEKSRVFLDSEMISKSLDGISLIGCGIVQIGEEVLSAKIREKVCLVNCGLVKCSQEQRSAVELIGRGIGLIKDMEEEEEGIEAGVQVVNADRYVL